MLIDFKDDDFSEKYESIREKLINTRSNNVFTNWLQYMVKNIDIIDVRMKSI